MSNKLITLCLFSRQRPWQCSEFLRTFHKFCLDIDLCDISIMVNIEPSYEESYNKLMAQYPSINWIRETDFENQLSNLIGTTKTPYMMFGCDDVFWIASFTLESAMETLTNDPSIFGYHYRLDTDITFCHSANKKVKQPKFKFLRTSVAYFDYKEGDTEFAYPFEVTSTVYRTEDVRTILRSIIHNNMNFSTPNHLEANGYLVCFQDIILNRKGACPIYRRCVIPTINRVQNNYNNPIYKESEKTPEELIECFQKDREFDETFYLRNTRASTHIGDFVLKD